VLSKTPNKSYIHEDDVIKLIMASVEVIFISVYFGFSVLYMKGRNKKVPNSASYLKEYYSMTELIARLLRYEAP